MTNTGDRRGARSCSATSPRERARIRPPQELKGLRQVTLDPGESTTVTIALDDRVRLLGPRRPRAELGSGCRHPRSRANVSVEATEPGWRVDPGVRLHISRSSADITHRRRRRQRVANRRRQSRARGARRRRSRASRRRRTSVAVHVRRVVAARNNGAADVGLGVAHAAHRVVVAHHRGGLRVPAANAWYASVAAPGQITLVRML